MLTRSRLSRIILTYADKICKTQNEYLDTIRLQKEKSVSSMPAVAGTLKTCYNANKERAKEYYERNDR